MPSPLRRCCLVVVALLLGSVATAAAPAVPAAAAPPAGGILVEGERIAGATVGRDGAASGGSFGSLVRGSSAVTARPGTYVLTARVRAASAARVDLLTADRTAGSYAIGAGWSIVTARVSISAQDPRIGVGSWVRTGRAPRIDVDWLHLASAPASFTVAGPSILRPDGTPYRVTGFNKADYADSRVRDGRLQGAVNEADAMYAWGATTVRIGLNQEFWLADCAVWAGDVATTYRRMVRAEVDRLLSRGVFVMLSLLSTERGADTGCTVTNGMLREMADQRSLTFWTSVATTYRNSPGVMFDLFNEPHSITPEVWRNGGTVTYGTYGRRSFTAVGMQGLYDTVRATGATNLVVVSGTNWASDPRVLLTNPLNGYGIVAGSHSYCHDCPADAPRPNALLDELNSAEVRTRLPLVLTETGWTGVDHPSFLDAMIRWADTNGVGWLAHAWLAGAGGGAADRYSIVSGGTRMLDVGGGFRTRYPTWTGLPVWNALAPVRVARGLQAHTVRY